MAGQHSDDRVGTESALEYLAEYAARFKGEYLRFTDPTPEGAGYPAILRSPFLEGGRLTCMLGRDGFALVDEGGEPTYEWQVAGGPAFLVDTNPTRKPDWLDKVYEANKIPPGGDVGLYRLVASSKLSIETWTGSLPVPLETASGGYNDLSIEVKLFDLTLAEVVERLSFGAFGPILDLHLKGADSSFWQPHILTNLGVATADRKHKRWFSRLELSPHISSTAWDRRAISARIGADLRRDFLAAVADVGQSGSISFGSDQVPLGLVHDRLAALTAAVDGLQALLDERGDAVEDTFHSYVERNPIVLDVYAEAISKPQFRYPAGSKSPTGKTFVEPDFVLRYPNNEYRLVELERPSKPLATKRGETRAGVTQATYQIAEWRHYIAEHYAEIQDRFPGIGHVLSRSWSSAAQPGRTWPELLMKTAWRCCNTTLVRSSHMTI